MRLNNYLKKIDRITIIVEQIKSYLVSENGYKTWKQFVDNQEVGDCQSISIDVARKFNVKHVFGEIDIDNEYIDNDGNEQIKMTHHWNVIKNYIYDFSKGTLKDYINFYKNEIYEPEVVDDNIYHRIR